MLQLVCPFCDAPIDRAAVASGERLRCSQCGHSFPAERGSVAQRTARRVDDLDRADDWTVHVPALPGRRIVRLVRRLAKRPALMLHLRRGRGIGRQSGCPTCGSVTRRRSGRWLSRAEMRRIGFALVVVVGLPAAVIFFLVVVCAPHGH